MPPPNPLQVYLGEENRMDQNLSVILRNAAREADELITSLAGSTKTGDVIRRSQLEGIRLELYRTSGRLWSSIGEELRTSITEAAAAVAKMEAEVVQPIYAAAGGVGQVRPNYLQATDTVQTYVARTANNIPLSEQVYRTKALADGQVDAVVDRALLLGQSARDLAKDVRGLIDPEVRGGVSYAARRLARTELNNAFHTTQIEQAQATPWATGMKWHLSRSHPKKDKCNEYAEGQHTEQFGPGVFLKTEVPRKPHPQCLCFMTTELPTVEEFRGMYRDGRYQAYIDGNVTAEEAIGGKGVRGSATVTRIRG